MVLPHNPLERKTLMSTTILSFQNRVVIETLHSEGRSLRYIANDPIIKLKRTLLSATSDQLQKVNE
jgi:hypothetical protein